MSNSQEVVAKYLRGDIDFGWYYESPVFVYDEKERPRVWTPDFFILKLGMFIEVVGSQQLFEDNEQIYQYRKEIYDKNGCHVIFVNFWKKDWKSFIVKRIKAIEQFRHNSVMKMLVAVL
jgi:hypothetical protein